MALGAVSYTSITWTVGDVITEAKLDNMVANDQAYDSHAAQGLLLNNDVGYYQKDSGANNKAVLNLGSDDVLRVGPLKEQNLAVDSDVDSMTILHGWFYETGDGTNRRKTGSITFGVTFSEIPFVTISCGLLATGAIPSSRGNISTLGDSTTGSLYPASLGAISTSTASFSYGVVSVDGAATTAPSSGQAFVIHWIAIGELA